MLKPDETATWDPGGEDWLNYLEARITALIADVSSDGESSSTHSRTELDSHANMPVVGKNTFVLTWLGKEVTVSPYSPAYEPLDIPLVDAALKYDCPYDGKTYILVVRNALYVPELEHNLLPPFMMREAGVSVRDCPKIQMDDPTEEDHAITFKETGFRIPLSL